MINYSPTYKAAKEVSKVIEKHFRTQIDAAHRRGDPDIAFPPDAAVIETVIDVAFWASLKKEEGYSTRISIAILPPEQTDNPLLFENILPLTSDMLTKLSPGVERPGVHLGVWYEGEKIFVWGATMKIPNLCFVLDVPEPGLLVIKHRRIEGFGKLSNVAVLVGDQIKMVDEATANVPDCPSLVESLLRINSATSLENSVNVLLQLAVSMRAHKRGGTLLVVPSVNDQWRKSIRHPIHYSVSPFFSGLSKLVRFEKEEKNLLNWQNALNREINIVAGLTAIDGATIMTDDYRLIAFGTKIKRMDGSPSVEKILFTEPVVGGPAIVMRPEQTGGTRHLSAAQFIYDQKEGMALVASQDGHFTLYSWSPCENLVHAHRIDALLL